MTLPTDPASSGRPDDGRTVDEPDVTDAGDDDMTVPLDAPIEAPVADLVEQRRAVPVDDERDR